MSKFTGEVRDFDGVTQPCYCCGARIRKKESFQMKRSNFINLSEHKKDNWVSANGKREIVCIETSNGPLTLGMCYEW